VRPLMENADVRQRMISEFDQLIGQLGKGNASDKAARAIIDEIETLT